MRRLVSSLVTIVSVILGGFPLAESAIYTSNSTINFEWSAPSSGSVASYNVFTSPDGVNFTLAGTTTSTSYTINTTVGNTYYMQVQAVSSTGLGGAMSDTSEPIVVVSDKNTLHTPWWSVENGYTSYIMVKNTTNSPVSLNANLIGRNNASFVLNTLTLAPNEARSILLNTYQANLSGAVNGAVEVTHSGNPGAIIADLMVWGANGFSVNTAFKERTAVSTNLYSPWWCIYSGYTSYIMVKNTTGNSVALNATLLGRDGSSYTPSITLAPHEARSILINNYQAYLPGVANGAVALTYAGNPGDVVGDVLVLGPEGFTFSASLKENVAASTKLHTAWWSTYPGYASYVMVQNTSSNSITINAKLLGRNGTSYTPSLTLAPHQARSIMINSYQGYLPGAVNGAVEVSHTGNPGDIIGDLIVFGPAGFSLSTDLKENVAASTTLHAPWWTTNSGYISYVMVRNTTNNSVTVNAKIRGSNGASYTPSMTLAPQQARAIVINSYQAYLPGAVDGTVEVTHNGNPGEVIGDLIVFGPSGFSTAAALR